MGSDFITKIGRVAEVFDGPHATPKKIDTGPYFLSISSLEGGQLDLSKSAHVSEEQFTKWTKRVTPREGDVLFSYETRLGEAALMPGGIKACLGRRMGLLRPDLDVVLPEYLLYAYLAPAFQTEIKKRTNHGATVNRIALKELPDFDIRIPPLDEQRNTVEILKSMNEKLSLNNQINQTLEQMAQMLFKSWFVDFDPVRQNMLNKKQANMKGEQANGLDASFLSPFLPKDVASLFPDKLVESELGLIPDGWEVSSLGEHLDALETGKRPKGGVKGITEGIPSVGAENILGVGKYNYGKEKFIPEVLFNKLKKGVIESEDVLIYKDGGKPGDFKPRFSMFGYGFPYEKFAINEHVFRIRSGTLGQAYLYCQMQEPYVFNDLRNKGAKAAIPGINQKDVNSLRLVVPSDLLLKEFNNLTSSIFKKILKNSLQSLELSRLRDTLLPKLLSGEIDLENVQVEQAKALVD